MKHSTFNYLRSCRQRHALTEEDLAFLIDYRSKGTISLIEAGTELPGLSKALALQVVFGMAPKDLFPGFYADVEDAVMRRAKTLYGDLEGDTDPRSAAKRKLLEDMAQRRDEDDAIEV
jgi:transcriptional regulator with XRE-family HTH domain